MRGGYYYIYTDDRYPIKLLTDYRYALKTSNRHFSLGDIFHKYVGSRYDSNNISDIRRGNMSGSLYYLNRE